MSQTAAKHTKTFKFVPKRTILLVKPNGNAPSGVVHKNATTKKSTLQKPAGTLLDRFKSIDFLMSGSRALLQIGAGAFKTPGCGSPFG